MSMQYEVIVEYFQAISKAFGTQPKIETVVHAILGDLLKFRWENKRDKIYVTISLAHVNPDNIPVLSILIERENKSFTYTDWIHFRGEEWAFEATDLSNAADVKSAIKVLAAAFDQSLANGLVKVLNGTAWLDVPTFRGVNE